jgi:hypothetical protein
MSEQSYSTPDGFWQEVWLLFGDSQIDDVIELETEIACEQKRLGDMRSMVRIALYNGFLLGIDYVREIMGDAGTRPPTITEKREDIIRPGLVLGIAGSVVKLNRKRRNRPSGCNLHQRE